RRARIGAQRIQHVSEVQARRTDFDLHFAGTRLSKHIRAECELVEDAAGLNIDAIGLVCRNGSDLIARLCCMRTRQTSDTTHTATQRDLLFAIGIPNLIEESDGLNVSA